MGNKQDFVIENGVLTQYTGPGGDVTIPEGVTAIGPGAFNRCHQLADELADEQGMVIIKVTIITTIIQVFTCSFAAYGFAKCRFRGRNTLFLIYVATIAVPWQVYMLPQYTMMNNVFHMVDTHAVLILLHSFDAFGVFLLRQFCMGIPDELLEAARIDGLSEYGIYRRIVLPQMGPSIATLVIFTFVSNWNDFMGPMIYLNSTELKTVQLGIRMFMGQYSTEYGLIMAASVVSLIPVIIVFLVFQKQFVQGIATSGLKG